MYIIAADVGGTKTRLAFANADDPCHVLFEARYSSVQYDSFEPLLQTFLHDCEAAGAMIEAISIDVLTLALPGLVSDSIARLTNLPWVINKQSLQDRFGFHTVRFMNDFQASVFGTSQLQAEDKIILNQGVFNVSENSGLPLENETRVAVGAGTGLGIAWADSNQKTACAHDTEGGHIDFAPADDTQIRLLKFLQLRHSHVSYERILSGDGLVSLYCFCADELGDDEVVGINAQRVNELAKKNDKAADNALSLFVQVYGAYIGNIALLFKPYGGIYITGGIAAKILNKMQSEDFINAYLNKGRMRTLVEQISVYLVTNERVGVLGAMSEAIKTHNKLSQQHLLQAKSLQETQPLQQPAVMQQVSK